MIGRAFCRVHAFAAIVVCWVGSPAARIAAAPLQAAQAVGAVGCKSSSCHGGAGEKRSQYLTWVEQDFHARAYAVLVNARSALMAETLSLPAASTSARCTICHSPFQSAPAAHLTKMARPDEGVSCENCHGAASSWLRGHTRKDWTYAMRVGAGMRDLRSYYVRANTCVACHQNLDADLLAAGHPELTFELDGQTVAEPKHWRDEDPWGGPRAWLVGQAVALRELSWWLAKSPRPEGNAAARWQALAWLLAKTTANQTRLALIEPPNDSADAAVFTAAQKQADALARQAAVVSWDRPRVTALLQVLAATEADFSASSAASSALLFQRASRLVPALDRLSRALEPQANVAEALAVLSQDVGTGVNFEPARFATDLTAFRRTLEGAP